MKIDHLTEWIHRSVGLSPETQSMVLISIVTIFIVLVLRRLILRVLFRSFEDVRIRYRWRKTSAYIAFLFTILILGRVWFEGFQSIATYLGLVSAGVAIALKDLLVNLAGWIFIIWRKPFEVGDRIQIGNQSGYPYGDWKLGRCGSEHRSSDSHSEWKSFHRATGQLS